VKVDTWHYVSKQESGLAEDYFQLVTKVKNEWRYTSAPPTCLHGAYTILPFFTVMGK